MSKRKKTLLMLAKGGVNQADVAASLHVSKRDVSACARALRERALTHDDVSEMSAARVDELFPTVWRTANEAYLQLELEAMVERKKRSPKLPVKLMWIEYCDDAAAAGKNCVEARRNLSSQRVAHSQRQVLDAVGVHELLRHSSDSPGSGSLRSSSSDSSWAF
jgi:hypothetical protein